MLKVTVYPGEPRHMQGVAKATQKPYSMHIQTAYIHTFDKNGNPNPVPEKIEVICDKDQVGNPIVHPAGEYQLHPSSVYVNRMGSLEVAPKLVPLKR